MSGTYSDRPGDEPESVDPAEPAADAGEGHSEDSYAAGLPTLMEGGGWGRTHDANAVIDYWAVPGPPFPAYADVQPAWRRWLASRAALVAIAALLGGVAGGVTVAGFAGGGAPDGGEAVEALRGSIGQLAAEVRSLKEGVGEGSQATADGLAAIEQRIAGAETAQARLSARIADLSTVRAPAAAPPPPAVSPEITGSVTPAEVPVAEDWVLWRVRNGRALVQSGAGYFEVETGSAVPGLGIVQRIVKQDGRWMVFTPNAVIVARG